MTTTPTALGREPLNRVAAGTSRRCLATALALSAALFALLALPAFGRAATIQTFPIPSPAAGASHIVAGPDGALWFTETDSYKVGRITASGQISEVAVPNNTTGVNGAGPTSIVSSGGKLWFVTNLGNTVYSLSTGGALSAVYNNSSSELFDLAPSDTGGVWAMPANGGQVGRIDPNGTVTPVAANYNNLLFGAAKGPNGSFWFNNGGSDLYQLTDSGSETSVPLSTTGINEGSDQVSSIAFDRNGDAWFTEFTPAEDITAGCCGQIGEVRDGVGKTVPIGRQSQKLGVEPLSMTLGPDGDMYFTFYRANPDDPGSFDGVGRVDPSTGKIQVVNVNPYIADDIAFGSDGDLWFVDNKDNLIGHASIGALFANAATLGPDGAAEQGGGGTGGGGTGGGTGVKAPAITLKLPAIPSLRRTGVANIGCSLAGAGRCTITAAMPASAARKLGLKVTKNAKTVSLGKGSAASKKAANVTVKLRFTKQFVHALAHVHGNVKLTVTAKAVVSGKSSPAAKHTLTLRH